MKTKLTMLSVVTVAFFAGCSPTPMRYVQNDGATTELTAIQKEQLKSALKSTDAFGTPGNPTAPESIQQLFKGDDLAGGAYHYRRMCMHCHGMSGDGRGPTAGPKETPWLVPHPRDYRNGTFKFTSTVGGKKPTREDLEQTLQLGVAGTSMPAFKVYYESDPEMMDNILDYVLLLSIRGETERVVANDVFEDDEITTDMVVEYAGNIATMWWAVDSRNEAASDANIVMPLSSRVPMSEASLVRGKKLYLDKTVQCFNCHGAEGKGDGLSGIAVDSELNKPDDWGNPQLPINFKLGFFHGGRKPVDLYRRIHTGVKGTGMPGQSTNLKPDQIWDLVNLVRALEYTDINDIPDAD